MVSLTTVDAAELWLNVWEEAVGRCAALRDTELLRHACAPCSADELDSLPVGTRDRLLLDLRGALFGARLQCTADCPECAEHCEWSCSTQSLMGAADSLCSDPGTRQWSRGGWRVSFRPVNSLDLASVGDCADEQLAVRRLLERCVSDARFEGQCIPAVELPEPLIAELSDAMAQADPLVATAISLTCPACAHQWAADFNPGAFLWAEFDAWAQRTLADVHVLASHYGWAERDILSLTPARRARYLAMVTA